MLEFGCLTSNSEFLDAGKSGAYLEVLTLSTGFPGREISFPDGKRGVYPVLEHGPPVH